MATDTQLISDLPVPPGEYLQEVVDELGVTQADLARRMGRPAQAINEIIKGEKAITPETALQLEQVVGVPAHIWTGLETRFQLVKARHKLQAQEQEEADKLSGWLKGLSYGRLADFAGLPVTRVTVEKVRMLRQFLGLSSLHNLEGVGALRPTFRQAQHVDVSQLALAVWLRRGELDAQGMQTSPFDRQRLVACLTNIRAMNVQHPGKFQPELRSLLAECGVAFVVRPHLPKTGVHGATFWLNPKKAVLMATIRGKYADKFWFTIFHEIGHLVRHGKYQTFLENGHTGSMTRKQEAEANFFAQENLIQSDDFKNFVAR